MPKNTPLARKLAKEYERMTGQKFPGGIHNAYIERTRASRDLLNAGAWKWSLQAIDLNHSSHLIGFGSQWTATEALKDPDELIDCSR